MQEHAATVKRLFSKYARVSATANPAIAVTGLEDAKKIAGTVITVKTDIGI